MPPQSQLPDNLARAHPASFLLRLPQEKQAVLREILRGFDLPDEQHEEYVEILVSHMKIAIDSYLSGFKSP